MNENRARRARSFGKAAMTYDTFRPGPPSSAVDWIRQRPGEVVVDVGAGTGALTRMLLNRFATVIAVEPDAEMRRELERNVVGVDIRTGTGEHLPLDNASVDVVTASTSWHWIDPEAGVREAARVLRPSGALIALWTGLDESSSFLTTAREMLGGINDADPELAATLSGERSPGDHTLVIPEWSKFGEVENSKFGFSLDLNADQLVGMLSTLSWIILLEEERKADVFATARRLLDEKLGVVGDVTVNVAFVCDAYCAIRQA